MGEIGAASDGLLYKLTGSSHDSETPRSRVYEHNIQGHGRLQTEWERHNRKSTRERNITVAGIDESNAILGSPVF